MQIDETKLYHFRFPFMNGMELGFPVPAQSREEAAQCLKNWFEEAQKELALLFPQVSPAMMSAEIPQSFNAMQIGLLEDLSAKAGRRPSEVLAEFVLEKTGLELTLENFKKIVPILEGNKPPEHGKKKS